jgi:DNA polymerase III epsilon subunit-like protein
VIHPEMPLKGAPVAVVDVESTGLDYTTARIVSIAVIAIDRLGETEPRVAFEALLNPGMPIPAEATKVNKITDEMVADAPDFADLSEEIARHTASPYLLAAFNAPYDFRVLRAEFERAGLGPEAPRWPWLDPMVWAFVTDKYKSGKSLAAVASRRGILLDAHGAVGDALVTAHLIPQLLRQLGRDGPRDREGNLKGRTFATGADLKNVGAFLAWQRRHALQVEVENAEFRVRNGNEVGELGWHTLEGVTPPTFNKPPRQTAECSSCGGPILWAVTKNGKRAPLDPDEIRGVRYDRVYLAHPDVVVAGHVEMLHVEGEVVKVVAVRDTVHPELERVVGRRSHFATCPHAQRHRRAS